MRAFQGGFLHAKAYIFYGDRPSAGCDRFEPVAAIVGSSNFTGPGLTTNRELNLAHKTILSGEDLDEAADPTVTRSAVDLAEFQEDAVKKARKILNTLRRIRDEDGAVIEEQEQFAELASNEFLLQQLRAVLDAGAREMLESLPDGIHSGLARPGARGIVFYFTARARRGDGREHFRCFYDLHTGRVVDNRLLIANLIACAPDTPRVIGDADVFGIQEKVVEAILARSRAQQSLEEAPKILDPIQQTVATALRGSMNHPDVDRRTVRELLQSLSAPLPGVQVRALRAAYQAFAANKDVARLIPP